MEVRYVLSKRALQTPRSPSAMRHARSALTLYSVCRPVAYRLRSYIFASLPPCLHSFPRIHVYGELAADNRAWCRQQLARLPFASACGRLIGYPGDIGRNASTVHPGPITHHIVRATL